MYRKSEEYGGLYLVSMELALQRESTETSVGEEQMG